MYIHPTARPRPSFTPSTPSSRPDAPASAAPRSAGLLESGHVAAEAAALDAYEAGLDTLTDQIGPTRITRADARASVWSRPPGPRFPSVDALETADPSPGTPNPYDPIHEHARWRAHAERTGMAVGVPGHPLGAIHRGRELNANGGLFDGDNPKRERQAFLTAAADWLSFANEELMRMIEAGADAGEIRSAASYFFAGGMSLEDATSTELARAEGGRAWRSLMKAFMTQDHHFVVTGRGRADAPRAGRTSSMHGGRGVLDRFDDLADAASRAGALRDEAIEGWHEWASSRNLTTEPSTERRHAQLSEALDRLEREVMGGLPPGTPVAVRTRIREALRVRRKAFLEARLAEPTRRDVPLEPDPPSREAGAPTPPQRSSERIPRLDRTEERRR